MRVEYKQPNQREQTDESIFAVNALPNNLTDLSCLMSFLTPLLADIVRPSRLNR